MNGMVAEAAGSVKGDQREKSYKPYGDQGPRWGFVSRTGGMGRQYRRVAQRMVYGARWSLLLRGRRERVAGAGCGKPRVAGPLTFKNGYAQHRAPRTALLPSSLQSPAKLSLYEACAAMAWEVAGNKRLEVLKLQQRLHATAPQMAHTDILMNENHDCLILVLLTEKHPLQRVRYTVGSSARVQKNSGGQTYRALSLATLTSGVDGDLRQFPLLSHFVFCLSVPNVTYVMCKRKKRARTPIALSLGPKHGRQTPEPFIKQGPLYCALYRASGQHAAPARLQIVERSPSHCQMNTRGQGIHGLGRQSPAM
eukprot:349907-Chlamydomonas_euryale.AAC.8